MTPSSFSNLSERAFFRMERVLIREWKGCLTSTDHRTPTHQDACADVATKTVNTTSECVASKRTRTKGIRVIGRLWLRIIWARSWWRQCPGLLCGLGSLLFGPCFNFCPPVCVGFFMGKRGRTHLVCSDSDRPVECSRGAWQFYVEILVVRVYSGGSK
jgi:hypothetical protein